MCTLASSAQLGRHLNAMNRDKKRHKQHPKTTSAATNASRSVSKTEKETKINNQLTILKEQGNNYWMMIQAIF